MRQKLSQRIIPEGFLEGGGTILVPLNVPGNHWMLGTLKMQLARFNEQTTKVKTEQLIRVCTFNSMTSYREQYDAPAASVLANTCEHVLTHYDKLLREKNPDAPPPPVRKYLIHRRYCDQQSKSDEKKNTCSFFTVGNMLMHFLHKESECIVDQEFVEKLLSYFFLLAFGARQHKAT